MNKISRVLLALGLVAIIAAFQNCSNPKGNKEAKITGSSVTPSSPSAGSSDPCYGAFCATYYDDLDQTILALNQIEGFPLDYDWGNGAPDPSMEADTFSIYYMGNFDFNDGDVEFVVTADDGIRVAVDGNIIIDAYYDQGPTEYRATVNLTGGIHQVEIFYYENGGGAVLRASWTQL